MKRVIDFLICTATIWLTSIAFIVVVQFSAAKETTPLEDAVNRPPPTVNVYVDEERGVVCYWVDKRSISCVNMKDAATREE